MQIRKYDPLQELRRVENDMNIFLQNDFQTTPFFDDFTPLDMYVEKGMLHIKLSLPGFTKDEVSAHIYNGAIEITAHRVDEDEPSTDRRYYFHESSYQYARRIGLPDGADASAAKANFDDGTLTITMPFEEREGGKEVKIA